jgi:hypothetical protein
MRALARRAWAAPQFGRHSLASFRVNQPPGASKFAGLQYGWPMAWLLALLP